LTSEIVLILIGALLGGFVNGLSGFGTSLVALPFWIHVVPPVIAAQLGAALGIAGHLQTLPALFQQIRWRQVAPYIAAGLLGVPLGTYLLPLVDPQMFKLGIGCLVVLFCSFQLASQDKLRVLGGGGAADALVGLVSGFLGGLAGMSGVLPTMWASLRGLAKNDKRTLFLSFNLTILTAMLCASAVLGLLTWDLGRATLIALPASFVGSRIGQWGYVRLDARRYDRLVVVLLLLSGASLLWNNIG
jgi:uncharacterized protein